MGSEKTGILGVPVNVNNSLPEHGATTFNDHGWRKASQFHHLIATFLTTLFIFAIYFVQGVLIARMLGPIGRGEFGSAVLFSRDLFLYVGLLGGIEIVNRYAAKPSCSESELKRSALGLGVFSGVLTALVSSIVSVAFLLIVDGGSKSYLIPLCLITSLFIPWEHVQLNVSAVDRGKGSFSRYNMNRLIYAAVFPMMLLLLTFYGTAGIESDRLLWLVCSLFVFSKVIGLYPTLRGIPLKDCVNSTFSWNRIDSEDAPTPRQLFQQGGPYAFSMLASELFERLDLLLIMALASVAECGFYFVAIPAASLLTIAPNALSVFTFNAGAERRKITIELAAQLMFATLLFQLVSWITLATIVPYLIVQFYGGEFEPAINFVWYLLPACAMKGMLQAIDAFLKGRGRPLIGVWARLVSLALMLSFVFFAFSSMGTVSVPIAACIGQLISLIIVSRFLWSEIVTNQPSIHV
ncbi:MAG: hypothetical protein AAGA30_15460 [Planctomycetota bacterium]